MSVITTDKSPESPSKAKKVLGWVVAAVATATISVLVAEFMGAINIRKWVSDLVAKPHAAQFIDPNSNQIPEGTVFTAEGPPQEVTKSKCFVRVKSADYIRFLDKNDVPYELSVDGIHYGPVVECGATETIFVRKRQF